MTKMRKQRNKRLNDILLSKPVGKHKAKFGNKIERARRKHLQNKEE